MNFLPHLAGRVIGTPLLVEQARLETILSVIGPRVGVEPTGFASDAQPNDRMDDLIVTPNGIAIVPIHGTLVKRAGAVEAASGLMRYSTIENMLMDAVTDPSVKAILMDIDSPGGEVGGVFDLAEMIFDARQTKPIWAMADDAFSAAYLIASASQRIYLPQTAGVGSIGVVAVHVDETERDAKEGRQYTTVFAGAQKNDFSRHEPLSTEARNRLQEEVDRLYGMFVSAVATHRDITESAVRATEAGLCFGKNAVTAGLADQVGTIRNALADLSAAIDPPKTTTIKEFRMDTSVPAARETATPVPEAGTTPPLNPAVPEGGHVQFQKNAQAIVDLCSLANAPQLAGDFIAKGMSEEDVRKDLMARRQTGPEIHSHVMPGDGTHAHSSTNLDANPVVTACRKLASKNREEK